MKPIQAKPVAPLQPIDRVGRAPADKKHFIVRPSYTPENAESFRATVFEVMIQTREDMLITTEQTGFKSGTLNLKAQDALKWLCDYHSEKEKYRQLRAEISMRRSVEPEGLRLYFKATGPNAAMKAQAIKDNSDWKEKFEGWLATAQPGDIWDSTTECKQPFVVEATDKAWLLKLLASLDGVEADITDGLIKVMR